MSKEQQKKALDTEIRRAQNKIKYMESKLFPHQTPPTSRPPDENHW